MPRKIGVDLVLCVCACVFFFVVVSVVLRLDRCMFTYYVGKPCKMSATRSQIILPLLPCFTDIHTIFHTQINERDWHVRYSRQYILSSKLSVGLLLFEAQAHGVRRECVRCAPSGKYSSFHLELHIIIENCLFLSYDFSAPCLTVGILAVGIMHIKSIEIGYSLILKLGKWTHILFHICVRVRVCCMCTVQYIPYSTVLAIFIKQLEFNEEEEVEDIAKRIGKLATKPRRL